MDIGLVGYLNPRLRILDLTGLTDRHIAKSPGRFLEKVYDPAYVLDQKPQQFIVIVFAADGTPYQVPRGPTRFRPYTPIEIALFGSDARPAGSTGLRRRSAVPPGRRTSRSRWGGRAFEFGMHYVLFVFQRRDEPAGPPG